MFNDGRAYFFLNNRQPH